MKKVFNFLRRNWTEIIMFMVVTTFCLIVLGFIFNGLYPNKFKFDLKALLALIGSISVGAVTTLGKHFIDSKYNSPIGSTPIYQGEDFTNGSQNNKPAK